MPQKINANKSKKKKIYKMLFEGGGIIDSLFPLFFKLSKMLYLI